MSAGPAKQACRRRTGVMPRVRVLAVEANRSGGAAVYTEELVRQLATRGYRLSLVCFEADRGLSEWAEVRRIPRPEFGHLPLAWRLSGLFQQRACDRAMDRLDLDRPDIVIGSAQQLIRSHARRFADCPLLYLPHSLVASKEVQTYPSGSRLHRFTTSWLFDHIEGWALRKSERTIRFTRAGCDALIEHFGRRVTPRFEILPAPVELPPAPTYGRRAGPVRLLFVGRLVETKNAAFLIEVLARLAHLEWTLDIVGDGEQRGRLEELVESSNLAGRIAFRGHQEDVGRWYSQADLLAFPSRLESAGLVILEAMSHGVPAISIRSDSERYHNVNHEIIFNNIDGFIADDEVHFGSLLAENLSEPGRLIAMGQAAREKIERKHGWYNHINRYEKIIDGALASRNVARRS